MNELYEIDINAKKYVGDLLYIANLIKNLMVNKDIGHIRIYSMDKVDEVVNDE